MSMRYAYYTIDGRIAYHQKLPEAWSDDEIALKVLEFNKMHQDRIAHLITVEDGSFENYLLEKIEKAKQRAAEDIQDALDALDAARDAIRGLEH